VVSASRTSRRAAVSAGLSLLVLVVAAFQPPPRVPPDRRPNIVLVLTDDQSFDSLPHDPPVMPALQAMMQDPTDHWIRFPNAFINTPLCCPSRATILTGRYSSHTGVQNNFEGGLFDDTSTVATWLHDAGYETALIGKYLNGYPFGYAPYVPPGWDRWLVRKQSGQGSLYYDYVLEDQGFPVVHGDEPGDYSTDVYASAAVSFLRSAPADRPFFLEIAPSAPHRPWTPAPGDVGAYADMPIATPPSVGEPDVSDKPAWVRRLPEPDAARLAQLRSLHERSFETLRAVDRLVATVVRTLRERGLLNRTVIVFLTDNGFSFGEHRWVSKACPYEECVRTPFLVRFPGASPHVDEHIVSNVDLAPTFAELAGTRPARPVDGRSLVPLLEGRPVPSWRTGVLLQYVGDRHVPAWWAIRTTGFLYVEYATGERELYDLMGRIGPPDPFELDNRAADPAYAIVLARLAARLAALRGG
jgi:N-acetylglucosamine-6-sulfatase